MHKKRNQKMIINIEKIKKNTYQNILDEREDDTISRISGYED